MDRQSKILLGVGIGGATLAALSLLLGSEETGDNVTNSPQRNLGNLKLVSVPGYGKWVMLRNDVADALAAMLMRARAEGIKAPFLEPVSGYRTISEQNVLWTNGLKKHGSEQEARRWVAKPGYSSHGTGRAVDLWLGEGTGNSDHAKKLLGSNAHSWLLSNASSFGFYPYEAEPWHWEYGSPHSTGEVYAQENAIGVREGYLT